MKQKTKTELIEENKNLSHLVLAALTVGATLTYDKESKTYGAAYIYDSQYADIYETHEAIRAGINIDDNGSLTEALYELTEDCNLARQCAADKIMMEESAQTEKHHNGAKIDKTEVTYLADLRNDYKKKAAVSKMVGQIVDAASVAVNR